MTDDKKKTAIPTTDTQPQAERAPAQAEQRELSVEDVDAEDGEDVKGGAIGWAGSGGA